MPDATANETPVVTDGSRWVTHNGGYPSSGIYTVHAIYGGLTCRNSEHQVVAKTPFVNPFPDRWMLTDPDGCEREITTQALVAWLVPFIPREQRRG